MEPLLRTRAIDEVISRLAGAQHRMVARWQLVGAGVGEEAVKYRLRARRLRRWYRGVYLVGPGEPTRRGRWMAAVLACGDGAALSHRTAAVHKGISNRDITRVDVTVAKRLRGPADVTTHFARLPFDEVTIHDGIPTTTVPRTLADLAATTTPREFQRALEQAEIQRLTDPLSLGDLLARDPRRRGAATIRRALTHAVDTQITREELEQRFRAFVAASGLPQPERNASVLGREVDALWEPQRLIVELDGRETHLTSFAFERDRERDRRLAVAGYLTIRITWRQLRDEPELVADDLRALLAARSDV
jgi:very-short-patch-repair endonuclease